MRACGAGIHISNMELCPCTIQDCDLLPSKCGNVKVRSNFTQRHTDLGGANSVFELSKNPVHPESNRNATRNTKLKHRLTNGYRSDLGSLRIENRYLSFRISVKVSLIIHTKGIKTAGS